METVRHKHKEETVNYGVYKKPSIIFGKRFTF